MGPVRRIINQGDQRILIIPLSKYSIDPSFIFFNP